MPMQVGMKTCSGCNESREEACFHRRASSRDGLQNRCKDCMRRWVDEHREMQRKTWRDSRKRTHFKRRYGISNEEYAAMVAAQGGLCLICHTAPKVLRVDHCHASGVVRGLLCDPCNSMLGFFADDTEAIREAILYVG